MNLFFSWGKETALQKAKKEYHIKQQIIGSGSFGIVRKCIKCSTGKEYAIKTIRKDPTILHVIKREIELLQQLVHHPHIIKLYNVYQDENYVHLVMELCQGGELYDYVIEKATRQQQQSSPSLLFPLFTEIQAAQIIHDILSAIQYCHDIKHIVHRDLKCENFLLLEKIRHRHDVSSPNFFPVIKLVDFGLARKYYNNNDDNNKNQKSSTNNNDNNKNNDNDPAVNQDGDTEDSNTNNSNDDDDDDDSNDGNTTINNNHDNSTDTITNVMTSSVGTVYYAAPEVIQAQPYTNSCDLWSIGIIAYVLLCGYVPFLGDNEVETLQMIISNELEFPSPDWDPMSLDAKDFILQLLQKDPTKRPLAKIALQHEWITKNIIYQQTKEEQEDEDEKEEENNKKSKNDAKEQQQQRQYKRRLLRIPSHDENNNHHHHNYKCMECAKAKELQCAIIFHVLAVLVAIGLLIVLRYRTFFFQLLKFGKLSN